jgi:hypothetical protein
MKVDFKISKKDILDKIRPEEIFSAFIDNPRPSKVYKVPWRTDEKESLTFFYSPSNELMFYDQAYKEGGDCITFYSKIFNVDRKQALIEIYNNFKLRDIKKIDYSKIVKEYKPKSIESKLSWKYSSTDSKKYEDAINYFKSFGISKETLDFFGVKPIDFYCIDDVMIRPENFSVVYEYEDNKCKIYTPLSSNKKYKFLDGIKGEYYQGYNKLPENGNIVFITSSYKDVMVLYELEFPAIAPKSEVIKIDDQIINELKTRFENVILFYDNDDAGLKAAEKLKNKYNINYIVTDKEKDPSDFSRKYSKEKLYEYIISELSNYNI